MVNIVPIKHLFRYQVPSDDYNVKHNQQHPVLIDGVNGTCLCS